MTCMKEQGNETNREERRKRVRKRKCKRVSRDRTTCRKTVENGGGEKVRYTSGEPVAVNIDEEQQLVEGRNYADAVAKGKERKLQVAMWDSFVRKLDKIINKGDDVTVCLPRATIEDVTETVGLVMCNGHGGSTLVHVVTNNA